MTEHESARVDELRRQLRSLGYLDAGVNRFVLGPARSARQPLAIAALASLRVGLIAAVLLGPSVAVGIGTRLPGLVTGTRDALIVAVYLGVLFGVVVSAFTFVASVTMARFAGVARRARFVSRAAGAIAGIGCLAYLTLWWRSANAGLAWSAPGWTGFALAIAVAISLLLGHAVTITAFAVMAARHPLERTASHSAAGWRMRAAAAVLAFAGASALLVLAAPSSPPPSVRAPLAVVSAGIRVRVIAIDGFDPDVYRRLADEGRLPALSSVLDRNQVRITADEFGDPARAWTTIATGQPPEVHGVHGLETRRVAGLQGSVASTETGGLARAMRGATDLMRLTRPSVASGTELRAKTIWEIAAEAGLRSAVINWWATWPAGTGGANAATVISDRAVLRLERGGALDAEIAPPQLYDTLRSEWPTIKNDAGHLVDSLLKTPADSTTAAALRRSGELDALQLVLAERLQDDRPDLLAVYLPGLDIAQHTLLASGEGASPSSMTRRLEGLREYYRFLDAALREMLAPKENEWIVLITQPGRMASGVQGLAGVAGVGTRSGLKTNARSVDVAATILHALGVPVGKDLGGSPVVDLFAPEWIGRFPVRYVATYGPRAASAGPRRGQPLDQEMIDRLRSLGYVR